MITKKYKFRPGITITETIITAVIAIIILLAVSSLMVDSQKGFNKLYEKAYSDVVNDSIAARKIFARAIRKCSQSSGAIVSVDATSVETKYYSTYGGTSVDMYSKFYLVNDELYLEDGIISPKQTVNLQKVCGNIDTLAFSTSGNTVLMHLVLDDTKHKSEVNTAALMHCP